MKPRSTTTTVLVLLFSLAALATLPLALALLPSRAEAEVTEAEGGIRFTYRNAAASAVHWAGVFNNWSATANPMTRDGDVWSVVLPLTPGDQQYKFVVDGQWLADPENPVTAGDFGNSAIKLSPDRKLVAMQATSNTRLNPKIYLGGRFITQYISRRVPLDDGRMELSRPDFDLDLDFNVRMNDVLDGHMLVNIESQTEDVQFYRTHLNLDRGSLHLHSGELDLVAFDNDSLSTWSDPLHLVGDVGIYHHAFGYNQQGIQGRKEILGNDVQFLYSDNFKTGGTDRPLLDSVSVPFALGAFRFADSSFQVTGGSPRGYYLRNFSDGAKNITAARVTRALSPQLRLGVSGRYDRGENFGKALVIEPLAADSGAAGGRNVASVGSTLERWWGAGGDVEFRPERWVVRAEYLHGDNQLNFVDGVRGTGVLLSRLQTGAPPRQDSVVVDTSALAGRLPLRNYKLASDDRATLSADYAPAAGLAWHAGWTLHRSRVTPLGNDSLVAFDVANHVNQVSLSGQKSWALASDRKAALRIALDYFRFSYQPGTSWLNQFWFDRHNFWLEAGEHVVSFDRLTLLGRQNAVSWKPALRLDLRSRPHQVDVAWLGTFNGTSLGKRPTYMENLLQTDVQLGARTWLYWDARWAKYDDPVLDLGHGYVDHFVRLSYEFSPAIQFQAGWGVDPYVLDRPVNEYEYIGRDQFLFALGANGSTAQDSYRSLSKLVPLAEKALEDERRIQLKAIVRF